MVLVIQQSMQLVIELPHIIYMVDRKKKNWLFCILLFYKPSQVATIFEHVQCKCMQDFNHKLVFFFISGKRSFVSRLMIFFIFLGYFPLPSPHLPLLGGCIFAFKMSQRREDSAITCWFQSEEKSPVTSYIFMFFIKLQLPSHLLTLQLDSVLIILVQKNYLDKWQQIDILRFKKILRYFPFACYRVK